MAHSRMRLDLLMVERGLAESREKAQRLIRAGLVVTDNQRLDKPGRLVPGDISLRVKGSECPYVSRGGIKLAGALARFDVDPDGRVALDLGASTGGFTDCLLQRGARRVYAIDVGRGQLHNKLLMDPRVVSRERTHIDDLQAEQFHPRPDLAVADLSFISLRRAFPVLARVLPPGGEGILLVKPQFEAGRDDVPKTGVVTDPAVHRRVVETLAEAVAADGLVLVDQCESPIQGGDGNVEFFFHIRTAR